MWIRRVALVLVLVAAGCKPSGTGDKEPGTTAPSAPTAAAEPAAADPVAPPSPPAPAVAEGSGTKQAEGSGAAAMAAADDAPPPPIEPQFLLESTGKDPKRALKYDLAAFRKESVVVVTEIDLASEIPGLGEQKNRLPRMAVTTEMTPGDTRDGVREVAFRYTDVVVTALDEQQAETAQIMTEQFQGLKTVRGTMTIGTDGRINTAQLESDRAVPELRAILSQLERSLLQMSVPFPAEPVGVGAKWTAVLGVPMEGIPIEQRVTFEVVSLTAKGAELKMSIVQSAVPHRVRMAGVPDDMVVRLTRLASTGEGTMKVTFGRVVPEMTTDVRLEMEMSMSQAGQGTQTMISRVANRTTLAPAK